MADTVQTLITAWVALAAAAISPGPNMVAVASRGMGAGARSALSVASGIALGGFFWAIFTSLGLGALFANFPIVLRVMGVVGGGYLTWLGVKGWRAVFRSGTSEIKPVQTMGFWRDTSYGLLVTATNPKVALLWGSLSTFVGSATQSAATLISFAGISSAILFIIYGGYGLLFSISGVRRLYSQFQSVADAIFGTIFLGIGAAMILRAL